MQWKPVVGGAHFGCIDLLGGADLAAYAWQKIETQAVFTMGAFPPGAVGSKAA